MAATVLALLLLGGGLACGTAPSPARPAAAPPARSAVPAPRRAPEPADPIQVFLNQRIGPMLAAQPQAGVVVGIIQGARSRVYGYGSVAPSTEAIPDGNTVYEVGAVTSVFTGLLLADLVVRGRVVLDDPVSKYLPDDAGPLAYRDQPIRLVHLATHASGLPFLPGDYARRQRRRNRQAYSAKRLYQFLRRFRPRWPPGAKYRYSPLGVGVLGHALSQHEGKSYETLILEHIVLPMGMSSTRLALSESMRSRLARGYDTRGRRVRVRRGVPVLAACCNVRSTVNDLLRLVAGYLRADGRLTAAMDLTVASYQDHRDGEHRLGLGWLDNRAGSMRYQVGRTRGFRSFVAFDRQDKLGIVILASCEQWDIDSLGTELMTFVAATPFSQAVSSRDPAP